MIMILINTLMITVAASYIIGCSGIIQKINLFFYRKIVGSNVRYNGFEIPLISCPKCVSFWTVLLYLLIIGTGVIPSVFIAVVMSYLSIIITEFIKCLTMVIRHSRVFCFVIKSRGELLSTKLL